MSGWRGRVLGVAAMLAFHLGSVSCATERAAINRVQPNYVAKSTFSADNDWYFRAFVTNVSATNAVSFEGLYGDTYRVRWDVQERMLFAYRVDADVLGIDGQTDGRYQGAAVAAFPITSHFDIRRAYNPATGEELNIIEENTSDRPWYAREYMRVDWSVNMLEGIEGFGFTSNSPTAYFVQGQATDPRAPGYNPDAPLFATYRGDDGRQRPYFDVTSRFTYRPDIATCYYLYQQFNCGPGDVRIRFSFMQVDPSRQYVPTAYPDVLQLRDQQGDYIRDGYGQIDSLPVFDRFGFIRTERSVYDRRRASTQTARQYNIGRFNIWQNWYTETRDAAGQVTRTPVPVRQRAVRPVVFYVSDDMPAEMIEANQRVVDDWDDAMARVVVTARLLDARAQPGREAPVVSREDVDAGLRAMRADADPLKRRVVWLCRNPGTAADYANTPCQEPGRAKRIGDLRYHFINWVSRPQPSGPLGIAIWSFDPLSGEQISSGCSVYGASIDTYAQQALDIVKLLNNSVSQRDFVNAEDVRSYIRNVVLRNRSSATETHSRADGTNMSERELAHIATQNLDDGVVQPAIDQQLVMGSGHYATDRLSLLAGSSLERSLTDTPDIRVMLGLPERGELSPEERRQLSLTNWATGDALEFNENRLRWMSGEFTTDPRLPRRASRGCMLPHEFADDQILGLASRYRDRLTGDHAEEQRIWQELRAQIYRGLTDHELGHAFGLRHNFAGSSDSMNYFDQYWDLRTANGTRTPQFGENPTPEQIDGRMGEYAYSSVMDYGSRFNSDNVGLGYYDRAAMLFGYGEITEIFPQFDAETMPNDPLVRFHIRGTNEPFIDDWGAIWRYYRHYTRMPLAFGGHQGLRRRAYVRFSDVVAEQIRMRTEGSGREVLRNRYWAVPYSFLSDEYAGSLWSERWDHGADVYEQVRDAMDRYRNYYLFDNFVRDSTSGLQKLRTLYGRVMTRYFSHVYRAYINWFFGRGDFRNLVCTGGYCNRDFGGRQNLWNYLAAQGGNLIENREWNQDPGGGLPTLLATRHGLDELFAALGTPPAHTQLRRDPETNVFTLPNFDQDSSSWPAITLGFEDGARYDYNSYDYASGYQYYNRWRWISSFYDKLAAITSLTNANANFVGRFNSDLRRFQLSYYMLFPQELTQAMGGMISYNDNFYSGIVDRAGRFTDLRPFSRCRGSDGTYGRCPGASGRDDSFVNSAPHIDPLNNLAYKSYASLYAMALFTANYSQQFNNSTRIWEIGNGEQFTPTDATRVVTFDDPFSLRQFAAIRATDLRYSPGAQLLEQGNRLRRRWENAASAALRNRLEAELRNTINMIDLVRSLYGIFGRTAF